MSEFLLSLLGSLGGIAIAAVLAKAWLEARVREELRREGEKHLELFRREQDTKKKVELVAEIIGTWMAYEPGAPVTKDHRTAMNKLLFQADLWLPSEVVIELNNLLQHAEEAKSFEEVLLLARSHLIGDRSLSVDDLGFMPAELERSGHPYSKQNAASPPPANEA